ncbi:MAG: COX15/CtaA family protein, partial [Leadbetterella sp.]
ATGSGMGCPDWPKCFGQWVPPTDVSQLPPNYQEIFGAKLKGEVIFNPLKTWIEYVNRLVGVLIGFFIFLTTVFAYRRYKKTEDFRIFWYSLIAFVLVVFEGWLGSKVVSSELHPVLITLHMLLSIVILAVLVFAILRSYKISGIFKPKVDTSGSFLVVLAISAMVGQIVFGTQIREGIDIAQKAFGDMNRNLWVNEVSGKVLFHGLFSLFILLISYFIYNKFKKEKGFLSKVSSWNLGIVSGSVLSGGILGFMGLPAVIQPFHLVFSVIILSLLFILLYSVYSKSL